MGGSLGPIAARVVGQAQQASNPTAFGTQYQAPAATPYVPQMSQAQMSQGLPPSPLVQQMMAQQAQPLRGLGALSALGIGYMPRTMQSLPPLPGYSVPIYRPNVPIRSRV